MCCSRRSRRGEKVIAETLGQIGCEQKEKKLLWIFTLSLLPLVAQQDVLKSLSLPAYISFFLFAKLKTEMQGQFCLNI